jgi:hypothetical protein
MTLTPLFKPGQVNLAKRIKNSAQISTRRRGTLINIIPIWLFPTTMIVLDIFASIVYFHYGDYRKGIYWLSAAILTASVTF